MRRFQILREFACELLGHRWREGFCRRCGWRDPLWLMFDLKFKDPLP